MNPEIGKKIMSKKTFNKKNTYFQDEMNPGSEFYL